MIESIEFTNFKSLRQTKLHLSPFTLLLGPNGSGKTTVLLALQAISTLAAQPANIPKHDPLTLHESRIRSVTQTDVNAAVEVNLRLLLENLVCAVQVKWAQQNQNASVQVQDDNRNPLNSKDRERVLTWLGNMQVFALDANHIGGSVPVSRAQLRHEGSNLAAVLDDLKDNYPDRWEQLLTEFRNWLPEYDHILFDKPNEGQKQLALRTRLGGHRIQSKDLSQGTRVALALLTLAYLPEPPTLIGLEEVDRGLHPRLLRNLQDALYRLSYPEACGESRAPIQVIATSHSPYLLDLYRDHPEEIVLAEKKGLEVSMCRLTDIEHYNEILGEAPLSEVWYSGVLGGVAVKP